MTPLSIICDKSPSLHHAAQYDPSGAILQVGGSTLLSRCRHCNQVIERCHRRSKQWHLARDVPAGDDHEDSLSLNDDRDVPQSGVED